MLLSCRISLLEVFIKTKQCFKKILGACRIILSRLVSDQLSFVRINHKKPFVSSTDNQVSDFIQKSLANRGSKIWLNFFKNLSI